MSVDYRAKLILGYKITEEQCNYIEEHYDIVQEARKKYNCAIDTWCVMEHSYFFGVQLASLDLEYDEYAEPIYAFTAYTNALNEILHKLHLKLDCSYARNYLINDVSY